MLNLGAYVPWLPFCDTIRLFINLLFILASQQERKKLSRRNWSPYKDKSYFTLYIRIRKGRKNRSSRNVSSYRYGSQEI